MSITAAPLFNRNGRVALATGLGVARTLCRQAPACSSKAACWPSTAAPAAPDTRLQSTGRRIHMRLYGHVHGHRFAPYSVWTMSRNGFTTTIQTNIAPHEAASCLHVKI
jgi:hypothetical protein